MEYVDFKSEKSAVPYFNTDPTDYGEERRAWQGAPSIAHSGGGRLFVAFMSGGIYEPDPRNCGLIIYSDDGGDSWSQPVFAVESQREMYLRCADIELWTAPDGALWTFWNETPYDGRLALPTYEQKIDMENDSEYHALEAQTVTWCSVCADPDGKELEWSDPRPLFPGIMRNHPLVTRCGRWLFGAAVTAPCPYYEIFASDDMGATFYPIRIGGRASGRAYDEPGFYYGKDGRIAMIVRMTEPVYHRFFSDDEGLSWTGPEELMAAASQRPCVGNDIDGSVWLIPSVHPKNRNGLRLMHSEDGQSFAEVLLLEDRERVSYAEFVQDEAGTLYVVYDRERNNKIRKSRILGVSEAAKEILFARIPRSAQQGMPDENTLRAHVISKAKINTLENIFTVETSPDDR